MSEISIKKRVRNKKRTYHYSAVVGGMLCMGLLPNNASANNMSYLEEMGKRLFFDTISINNNMSCSTCHSAGTGGTHGDSETNRTIVGSEASVPGRFGSLKPPTNQYAQFKDSEGDIVGLVNFSEECLTPFGPAPCGGAFWNGRANGDLIEKAGIDVFAGLDPEYKEMYEDYIGAVTDQAHASPYINPVEQAHLSKEDVCAQVKSTSWGDELFEYAWGTEHSCDGEDIDTTFARYAVALTAWQMSEDNNNFSSKRDIALRNDADGVFPLDQLSDEENRGHDLFYGVGPGPRFGARCFFCHQSENDGGVSKKERYTNDRYFNIGSPKNQQIQGNPAADMGLFAQTGNENHKGTQKVPTLRNVDKRPDPNFVKAYTHNGWYKSLEQLVHFYNTSAVPTTAEEIEECNSVTTDEEKMAVSTACFFGKTRCEAHITTAEDAMAENCWPAPGVEENIARFAVGDLRLSTEDESAVVAYLKTLSDIKTVKPPQPYRSRKYEERRRR